MDCNWLNPTERGAVAKHSRLLVSYTMRLREQVEYVWGRIARGDAVQDRAYYHLDYLIIAAKSALSGDVLACVDPAVIADLRRACVEAYLVEYGKDPAGWLAEWARVWPDVKSPVSTFTMPPKLPISAADTNKAKVASDTAAVEQLVTAATTALEKQQIAWAKKNIEAVRAILVDGGGTKYVHAARVGGAIPQGVTGQAFGRLQKAAKRLYAMLPRLNALAAKKSPVGTISPGFVFDEYGPPGPAPIVDLPGPSLMDRTAAWVKDHPWLTVVGLGTAGYFAWKKWGR